jgi:hypothetical protein
MKVYKYRQLFAYGPSSWSYADPADVGFEEYFAECLQREYEWSDKYRGCDIELVDAPVEYITELLTRYESKAEYAAKRIAELKEILGYTP